MPTPVQITVTVDPSQGVAALQQIGAAATDIGNKTSAAALKGAAAVAALTDQWEKEQQEIAKATALMEQQTEATAAQESASRKAALAFQGIASDQTKASLAGRILEQQFGVTNRALNQVISRSAIAGPLMAGLFNVAIFDAGAQALLRVGQGIIKITDDMGGYTDAVKQSYAESVKASQTAFLNPASLEIARAHTAELDKQSAKIQAVSQAYVSRKDAVMASGSLEGAITTFLGYDLINIMAQGTATEKQIKLDDQRRQLLEKETALIKQMNDEAAKGAESNALIGLSGFAKIQQQYKNTIADINRDTPAGLQNTEAVQNARANAQQKADKESGEIQKQMADETMQTYDRVVENRLQGIAKIRLQEQDQIQQEESTLAKRLGLSDSEVEATALFQAKKLQITDDANNKIAALNLQAETQTEALEKQARDAQLTGDDLILSHKQDSLNAVVKAYANNEIDVQQYVRRIVAINVAADEEIAANDKVVVEKRKALLDKSSEEMKDANDAAALASVPPWQKTYAQIVIESEKRLAAIDQQERAATAQFGDDQQAMVAITALAQAKRGAVWAEENEKIVAENQKLTEQLGSDLESIFNDISSGNIGQRILNNMEKLFFQIVAKWLLASNAMQSTFGQVFGTLLGGPGSTAQNVSGANGLAGLFGGSSSGGSFSSFGAGAPASGSGSGTFSLGGLFGGSSSTAGAGSAGAGSGSGLDFGGLFPPGTAASTNSVPGATGGSGSLTTTAISAITGGGAGSLSLGGVARGAGSSALGVAGSTQQGIAALVGLAAMLGGSKLGGVGLAGTTALGLLLTGKLGGIISSLYGTALGGVGTGALFGGAIGGAIGFGVGSQFGKTAGGLSGAGSGALTGFLVGGPIGALVGGLIGLLGGLFGGFFGDGKRKKQANALFDSQIGPAIQKIEDDFKGFSIDFPTAISNLEDLRTQSQTQLGTLKGQGNDVFNKKVSPAIDAAEAVVNQYETERLRRQGLVFGPPQFHDGGYVNAGAATFTRTPGELLAVLKHGEFVMNPRATSRIGVDNLHAANSGGSIGGVTLGDIHFHVGTLDRAYMASPTGFKKDLKQVVTQMRREGQL
jgi:hypothetical protein